MTKCDNAECDPVEQVRGEMGEGDYFGQEHDYHAKVELSIENKDDYRIACKHCSLATPWGKRIDSLASGQVVDVSDAEWGPRKQWPKMIERREKIEEARKLLREVGVPGVGT